ncbi:restriction endonuclease subunit S [Sorangium sp. So ce406]|uniref:restriction endonuclease subunit S n=1 Tax=Sorangium sp. So ce406 TaxID=3133311 RepID=UPI003F5BAFA1
MSARPEGWASATVGELSTLIQYGSSAKTSESSTGVPVLRMGNIVEGRLVFGELKILPKDHHEFPELLLQPQDVLFNRTNSPELVGKTAVYEGYPAPCSFASYLLRVRLRGYEPKLLAHYINSWEGRNWISSVVNQQVGQANVNGSKLRELTVPVPPIEEQRRIVAKIEALTAKSRRAKEALDAIPALVERFRQSVLAAAFRGDLTADWREKNPDVEPAEELLKRIRAERRRRWEEAELAKMRAKGKAPGDDRWKEKYEEPTPVDASELPEVPDGWAWARIAELGQDPLAPVQTGPFGAQLHSSEFVVTGVPVIAVGNLTGVGFTDQGLYYVTEEKARQLSRYDVQAGDVLFARSGATLGKVCVAPGHVRDWRMTGHILRFRVNQEVVAPELVVYALSGAPYVKNQVASGIRGMTRPGYNTDLLERILVPVPPRAEQVKILRRLGYIFQRIESLKDQHADLARILGDLSRAILAKAFRGELVPQDPNDEPASALLERLRAEREQNGQPTTGAGRRRAGASPPPAPSTPAERGRRPQASRRSQAPARSRG